jgi:hypothetical protein
MDSASANQNSFDEQLSRLHWHIIRSDSLRGSVASRAGILLRTNALVVAGITLALGWSSRRPGALLVTGLLVTFVCVGISITNAALANATVYRRRDQSPDQSVRPASIYSLVDYDGSEAFEYFERHIASQTPEETLQEALRELWSCRHLHRYRYSRLRDALRWLLAALATLLITVALSVI